jgi:hypothetical protein
MTTNLFTRGNPKIEKGQKKGYLTYILHLAPHNLSGYQVCAMADGCQIPCLNLAGRGGMFKKGESSNIIQKARIRKTKQFFEIREWFMARIVKEIQNGIKYANKHNLIPVFRMNGTSDLPWEKFRVTVNGVEYRNIMEAFPQIQFYDYTKVYGRKVPSNYHLTFSRSANNELNVIKAIQAGYNIAVVFDNKKPMPETFMGLPVINGDETDLRFLDNTNSIVGLKAKGPAKKDYSGFVVR